MSRPITRQTQMGVHMGSAASVRLDTKQIDNMAFKVNVVAKTADYTVKASESGTFFTTFGATANVNFTLPAFADGLVYWFFNAGAVTMTVTSGTGNLMIAHNLVTADAVGFETGSELLGGMIQVVSDGTKWFSIVYAEETVAVAVTDA